MDKFLIIDGNNIAYRAFYALPPLTNLKGEQTNAIFGFVNILVKAIKDINPKYIAVAFDKGKNTFRHKMYSEYKALRKPTPTELISQLKELKNLLKIMQIKVLESDEIEADDIIGILSRKFDVQSYILSADKDVLQLIKDNVFVVVPKKNITDSKIVTEEEFSKEYEGLKPTQIIDLKALMGDSSDNLIGVLGIGEVGAKKLIKEYSTISNLYNNISQINGKIKDKLEEGKESAFLTYKLATIKLDYDLSVNKSDFELKFPWNNDVVEYFKENQFNALLKKEELFLNLEKTEKIPTINQTNLIEIKTTEQLKNAIAKISNCNYFSFNLSDANCNIFFNNTEYYIPFDGDLLSLGLSLNEVINELKPFLESNNIEKSVFDYKTLLHFLSKYNTTINNVTFDVNIARYLCNSNAEYGVTLEKVAEENGISCVNFGGVIENLKNIYLEQLQKLDLLNLYNNLEMPLVKVLFSMETDGFKIDTFALSELENKYEKKIYELTKEIYELANCEFNLESPKQMSEVLFSKLNLISKNNKKLSTNVNVLNELYYSHSIIPKILEYRQVSKLYNTYIKAFNRMLDKDNKIHTIFNQTLTSTGRLSSMEPNLQNIPVRTSEGKNLRKIFISSFENGKIISADYNQIELRLLASFSGDEKLINAYNNSEDIHSRTASEIFNIPITDVDSDTRRKAKAINFGIVYGISDFGLSKEIGITRANANLYIKKYFEKYPKIEQYMQENVNFAKKFGYIKTLFGRIRFIPEIHGANFNIRQFGERAAMNMPLQGSASDIIKMAMIKVYNKIKTMNLKSKLIMQVHDELIVDAPINEVNEVSNILQTEMENVVNNLPVKLLSNVGIGDNWLDAH